MTYNEIIEHISEVEGLDKKVIEMIIRHQFKVVTETMREGKWEPVRLPYFGQFGVKPGRIMKLALSYQYYANVEQS